MFHSISDFFRVTSTANNFLSEEIKMRCIDLRLLEMFDNLSDFSPLKFFLIIVFVNCRVYIAVIFSFFVQLIETRGVNFSCTYVDVERRNDSLTACAVNKLVITAPNQRVTSINGQTGIFRHYQNVKVLSVHQQTVHFIPQGIAELFPNIEVISIVNSNLKSIEQSDLKPFTELTEIYLYGNKLEKLDSDLFESNPNIIHIDFSSNQLKFVGKNILKPLTKLEYADFEGNSCINKVAGNRSEVEELISESEYECTADNTQSNGIISSSVFSLLVADFFVILFAIR